jgi:hypothetical protein
MRPSRQFASIAGLTFGAAVCLSIGVAPAAAQRAIAAAETQQRGQIVCGGESLAAARQCAVAKCRSGGGRDCRITAACQPAQWSGSMLVTLQGSKLSIAICGVPSRPGLLARMKDICREHRARGLESCTLETVWTPAGDAETADLRWNRQALGIARWR